MTIEITGKIEMRTDFWGEVISAKLVVNPNELKDALSHFDAKGEEVIVQIRSKEK